MVKFPRTRPEESLGFLLWQTGNLWQRKMAKVLRPTNLTLVQFALLAGTAWLERGSQSITQASLARHEKTDVMMTSQVLRNLESRGLIRRRPSESDTRANTVALTEEGAARLAKAIELVQKVELQFFRPVEKKRQDLLNALESLVEVNGRGEEAK